jgi:hypothetical protein
LGAEAAKNQDILEFMFEFSTRDTLYGINPYQYSSGSSMQVDERSASVMIQIVRSSDSL